MHIKEGKGWDDAKDRENMADMKWINCNGSICVRREQAGESVVKKVRASKCNSKGMLCWTCNHYEGAQKWADYVTTRWENSLEEQIWWTEEIRTLKECRERTMSWEKMSEKTKIS